MLLELLVILVLAIINGLLSMAELALVSVRKSWLEQQVEEGNANAQIALDLTKTPEEFLSTIQCGITLIGIIAGAFGGATLAERLVPLFADLPLIAHYSKPISFGLVVILITYVTIVIGELVPKSLALRFAEPIALTTAKPMKFFSVLAAPLVKILGGSTNFILKSFKIEIDHSRDVTQDEIKTLIEQGAEAGVVEEVEQQMVERVFRLGDRSITLLMTPRKDVTWIDMHDSLESNLKKMIDSQHSHFPICDGNPDTIIGMVSIKALLARLSNQEKIEFHDMITPPLYVPDNLPALRVLSRFKEVGTHIAIVLDEYGSFEGVVTLNDFMESILGEMREGQRSEPEVVTRPDGSWLIDGQFAADELKELLEVVALPEEEKGNYETIAGLIMTMLGRIPKIGDSFDWENFSFEVVDMDGNRIDRVLVSKHPLPRTDKSDEEDKAA